MRTVVAIISATVVVIGLAAAAAVYLMQQQEPQGEEILVLCGGSMRAALEESIEKYRAVAPDVQVMGTYGGSGELCIQIKETGRGDLYLCHDPFMPWAADQGLIAEWTRLAILKVVIVVPQGNPQKIEKLEDLARPGLRLGIGNQTYSTSGQITKALLAAKKYGEAIRKNVRVETKGHQSRCNDVASGLLDAALVWDAVAHLFADRLDIISLDAEFAGIDAITSATYKQSDLKETGVTLGIIEGAAQRPAVKTFYDWLAGPEGRAVFKGKGFTGTEPR